MRTQLISAALVVLSTTALGGQDKNWSAALEQQLKDAYPLTKMDRGFFAGKTALKDTGIVVTSLVAGIPAHDGEGLFIRIARVKDGRLLNPQARTGDGAYVTKVGDQFYIRDITVDDDRVGLDLVTVDSISETIRGTTRGQRFYAKVRFEFDKGYLPTASAADVIKAISAILATDSQVAAARTIELGQTIEQVEKIFGKPDAVAKLGAKTIYTYKSMKVIFTDGKVTDVQ